MRARATTSTMQPRITTQNGFFMVCAIMPDQKDGGPADCWPPWAHEIPSLHDLMRPTHLSLNGPACQETGK